MSFFNRHKIVFKYIAVGISASLVDLFLLFILKEYFQWWYLTSAILALMISFSSAFVIQKYWTFGDFSGHNIHGQFFWYFLTVILSIIANLIVLSALVEFSSIHYMTAQAVSLCVVGVFGFILNVRNVFSHTHADSGLVIAAGIFPPEIGGPASHIQKLAKELGARGVNVSVVTYSRARGKSTDDSYDVTRIPSGLPIVIRGLAYLVSLFLLSVKHSSIFAQDVTSTGIPAMIVKKILPHKKFVVRIGGDLLWERRVESGGTKKSLPDYYASGAYKGERLFKVGRCVMSVANQVIVPAEFLREIYIKYYNVMPNKIKVIKNPVPTIEDSRKPSFPLGANPSRKERIILFAGRFIKLKNVERLIKAFAAIYGDIEPARLLLVGDGPERNSYLKMIDETTSLKDKITVIDTLSRDKLLARISEADLCVCPSLSEVNSNFTLECLACNKLVLLTRNNGLSVTLPKDMLFDPDSQEELQNKMKALLSGEYDISELQKLVAVESSNNSWEKVVAEYSKIFNL